MLGRARSPKFVFHEYRLARVPSWRRQLGRGW
jgi:hypothetical protein